MDKEAKEAKRIAEATAELGDLSYNVYEAGNTPSGSIVDWDASEVDSEEEAEIAQALVGGDTCADEDLGSEDLAPMVSRKRRCIRTSSSDDPAYEPEEEGRAHHRTSTPMETTTEPSLIDDAVLAALDASWGSEPAKTEAEKVKGDDKSIIDGDVLAALDASWDSPPDPRLGKWQSPPPSSPSPTTANDSGPLYPYPTQGRREWEWRETVGWHSHYADTSTESVIQAPAIRGQRRRVVSDSDSDTAPVNNSLLLFNPADYGEVESGERAKHSANLIGYRYGSQKRWTWAAETRRRRWRRVTMNRPFPKLTLP